MYADPSGGLTKCSQQHNWFNQWRLMYVNMLSEYRVGMERENYFRIFRRNLFNQTFKLNIIE